MTELAGLKVGQGRRVYVSAAPESTFGAAQTLTHCLIHPLGGDPLERTPERVPNSEYSSGIATDHATGHMVIGHGLNKPLPLYATLEALGIFLAKCMNGGDTVAGGAAPYTHSLAYASLPDLLLGMTIEDHLAGSVGVAATDRKHVGVCVDSVEFSVGRSGRARLNIGLVGSGKLDAVGTITEAGLVIPAELIEGPKCRVCLGPATSLGVTAWDGSLEVSATAGLFPTVDAGVPDISKYVEEFTFRVQNGCAAGERELGHSASTGVYVGRALPRNRVVEVEIRFLYGTPFSTLLHAAGDATNTVQAQQTILLNIASDITGHGGAFAWPVCEIPPEALSGLTGKGPLAPTVKFTALASAANQPMVAKIADYSPQDYC